jgi:hypothetical protein
MAMIRSSTRRWTSRACEESNSPFPPRAARIANASESADSRSTHRRRGLSGLRGESRHQAVCRTLANPVAIESGSAEPSATASTRERSTERGEISVLRMAQNRSPRVWGASDYCFIPQRLATPTNLPALPARAAPGG